MNSNRIIDIKRVESNPTEPITLAEAKAKLIIDFTDDDAQITLLITSCRKAVENSIHVSIVTKTITLTADLFREWELPYGPVTGILAVSTRTSNNEGSGPAAYTTQEKGWEIDGDEFLSFSPSGALVSSSDLWYPDHYNRFGYPNGQRYKIIYTAGYGTVPGDLKDAILMQIVHDYENRGDVDLINVNRGLCIEAENLAGSYRRLLWF